MASIVHRYFFAEALALTAAQKATLVAQLRALMHDAADPQPCKRNHSRVNLAGTAVIFEAALDADHLTPLRIRNRLAAIFNVSQTSITYTTASTQCGDVATFKYGTQNRVRFGVFGGVDADWGSSLQSVQAYLAANRAAWEGEATP